MDMIRSTEQKANRQLTKNWHSNVPSPCGIHRTLTRLLNLIHAHSPASISACSRLRILGAPTGNAHIISMDPERPKNHGVLTFGRAIHWDEFDALANQRVTNAGSERSARICLHNVSAVVRIIRGGNLPIG